MHHTLRKLAAFGFFLIAACACNSKGSISNAYKFPVAATKDVSVQINIAFKLADSAGPKVGLDSTAFTLTGYVLDGGAQPVAIGYPGGSDPVDGLAVTLTGTTMSFPATVRVPANVTPGANGYDFHFVLTPQATSLNLADAVVPSLHTLTANVLPGTAAAANSANLSLVTTAAYQFLNGMSVDLSTAAASSAFSALISALLPKMQAVEAAANPSGTPSLAVYASAVADALGYQAVTDTALQKQIVTALVPAAQTLPNDLDLSAANQVVAASLTSTLIAIDKLVSGNGLGTPTSAEAQVFTSTYAAAIAVPAPASYAGVVFAPAGVSFQDTDTSSLVGGSIVITPPQIAAGVTAYNVYFGGDAFAQAQIKLAGTVAASSSPLALVLPAGTAVPSGATRFWVYPVAGSHELPIAVSAAIDNDVNNTVGAPSAPGSLTAVGGAKSMTLTWNAVSNASSYNLYWSTTSTVTKSSTKITGVTSPYVQSSLTVGTTYYYAVSAVDTAGESTLSTTAHGTTVPTLSWIGALTANTVVGTWSTSTATQTNASIDGGLAAPLGLAIDTVNQKMYVADLSNSRVQRFDLTTGASTGSIGFTTGAAGTCANGVQSGWCTGGTFGSSAADGGFNQPYGVAVNAATDRLFVTDQQNSRISLFVASTGAFLGSIGEVTSVAGGGTCTVGIATSWCTGGTFTSSNSDGSYGQLDQIAADSVNSYLYATRTGEASVVKINMTTGAFVGALGHLQTNGGSCVLSGGAAAGWCTGGTYDSHSTDASFNDPSGVAVDPTHDLMIVADGGASSLSKFTLSTGAFIGRIDSTAGAAGTCLAGVQTGWCTGGTFALASGDGGFRFPDGLGIDATNGFLFVANEGNHNVSKFDLVAGTPLGGQGYFSVATGTCVLGDYDFCTGGTFATYSQLGGYSSLANVQVGDGFLYVVDGNNSAITRVIE